MRLGALTVSILTITFVIGAARSENSSTQKRGTKSDEIKTLDKSKPEASPAPSGLEIELISPESGSIIKEQSPTFRWKVSNLPQGEKVSYSLRIVEVRKGQTLPDALKKNPAAFERKNLPNTSVQVPKEKGLTNGKVYAAQVTAFGPNNSPLGGGGVSVFGFGWQFNFCFLLPLPSLDFCLGQNSGLTVAAAIITGNGPLSWTLTPQNTNDPTVNGSSGPIIIPPSSLPTTAGPHTYSLTVTKGSCTLTATITINGFPPPTVGTITVTQTNFCPGDAFAVLSLSASSGHVQWYASTSQSNVFNNPMWGAMNNTVLNTNNLSQTTYYGVAVTSPNGGPCPPAYSNIVAVTVLPPPTPPVITPPAFICAGGNATVHVTSASGTGSYQWICNGAPCGPSSTTPPTSMTVTDPGNYALEFTDSCSTVSSNVVTIPLDTLAVTITGPCCPCKGAKVQLCAQVTGGATPYQYAWTTPSGHPTTACTLVVANATSTSTVTVTDANGCKATAQFIMTVCP